MCAVVKAVEAYLKTGKTLPVNVKARQLLYAPQHQIMPAPTPHAQPS